MPCCPSTTRGCPSHSATCPTAPASSSRTPRTHSGRLTPDGPVGNCAHSDMCVFSFHPVKPITTGEGGMVTTNDDDLAARLRRFRSHGIDRTPTDEPWAYDAVEVGYNYRMTDLQSALGISQIDRLDRFIERRNEIADRYRDLLADLPVLLPPMAHGGYRHGYHLFAIRVAEPTAGLHLPARTRNRRAGPLRTGAPSHREQRRTAARRRACRCATRSTPA